MGKLIWNTVILIAGSTVMMAEMLAVGLLFIGATLIVMTRRLTGTRAA